MLVERWEMDLREGRMVEGLVQDTLQRVVAELLRMRNLKARSILARDN